jgi:hypothetical protein
MVIAKKSLASIAVILALVHMGIYAVCDHDLIIELKGAAFVPTSSRLKNIYGNAIGNVGGEATFQLSSCNEHWYGFASVDYLNKKGHSIGLCAPTKVDLVPLALGVKYFIPFCYGNFYLGLGFQPLYVKTHNPPYVAPCTSQWAFGGIAKIGSYFDLPCDWVFDLFIDYSFAKTGCKKCSNAPSAVIPLKASIDGVIFGAGLGYRF